MDASYYLYPFKNCVLRTYHHLKEGIRQTQDWLSNYRSKKTQVIYTLAMTVFISHYHWASIYQPSYLDESFYTLNHLKIYGPLTIFSIGCTFFNKSSIAWAINSGQFFSGLLHLFKQQKNGIELEKSNSFLLEKSIINNKTILVISPLVALIINILIYKLLNAQTNKGPLGYKIQSQLPNWLKKWEKNGLVSKDKIVDYDGDLLIGLPRLVIFQAIRHLPAQEVYDTFSKQWQDKDFKAFSLLKEQLERVDEDKFEKALIGEEHFDSQSSTPLLTKEERALFNNFTSWTQVFLHQIKIIQEINNISLKHLSD